MTTQTVRALTRPLKEKPSTKVSTEHLSFLKTLDTSDYWIETVSGKHFHFLAPRPEEIDIEDIAHALANTCRYSGHSKKFYSVAEHSVAVSELCDNPIQGLLHDASEAYITDIASPVKPILANYKDLEEVVMFAIAEKYNIGWPLHPSVKVADVVQLSTEARHLLPSKGEGWNYWSYLNGGRPKGRGIVPRCLLPKEAKKLFLDKFEELTE